MAFKPGLSVASITRMLAGVALASAMLLPLAAIGQALPFLAPGDSYFRHQVELETDDGEIPLSTTWPLPTLDIPANERDSLHGFSQPASSTDADVFASAAGKPTRLRTFDDTPREEGEAGLQAGWAIGEHAAGALRMAYDFKPADGMHYRLDGSYAAWRLGNWWLTAGLQDRWWGPGWDSSLILSSNARPMPGIGLERPSSKAPAWKWLRWIGPWRLTTFMDRMESERPDVDKPLFWGLRVTAQPIKGLEIGLSRTAIWCGTGRPCGLRTFWSLLTTRGNLANNEMAIPNFATIPGEQEGAIDMRYHVPGTGAAVYWQEYGQTYDNGNFRPRWTLQLLGVEYASHSVADGRLRTFLEFSDTTCSALSVASSDKPSYGCAYEKPVYGDGYRYRGRAIGDSMDRDGKRFTLGLLYIDDGDRLWDLRLRHFDLNQGGIAEVVLEPQSVTTVTEKLWNVEFQLYGAIGHFRYSVGIGADYGGPVADLHNALVGRGFISLSHPW